MRCGYGQGRGRRARPNASRPQQTGGLPPPAGGTDTCPGAAACAGPRPFSGAPGWTPAVPAAVPAAVPPSPLRPSFPPPAPLSRLPAASSLSVPCPLPASRPAPRPKPRPGRWRSAPPSASATRGRRREAGAGGDGAGKRPNRLGYRSTRPGPFGWTSEWDPEGGGGAVGNSPAGRGDPGGVRRGA